MMQTRRELQRQPAQCSLAVVRLTGGPSVPVWHTRSRTRRRRRQLAGMRGRRNQALTGGEPLPPVAASPDALTADLDWFLAIEDEVFASVAAQAKAQ